MLEMKRDIKTLIGNQLEIKEQVKKTNGRVARLEIWRSFVLGGLSVIAMLLIPMFLAWFGKQL